MPARPSAAALLGGLVLLSACGSDPRAKSDDGDGTPAPSIPDYTRSPCYGNPRTTLVYDGVTHGMREVPATCRAEGNRTLLYVEDDLWQVSRTPDASPITQDEVDAFMVGYELRGRPTSFRPDLGVLPTDELVFGAFDPAALPEGKLPVFVVDSGGAGDGYLCSWCDELSLHLDGPVLRSLHTDKTLSIAAHESFHGIHRSHDPNETVWVDESLAEAAMTVNGFFTDGDWLDDFLRDPNVAWGPGVNDPTSFHYGAGLLFGTYLWERGGRNLLHAITEEPLDDWEGIDAALARTGDSETGFDVYLDMALATFLDDPASGYSFDSFDLAGGALPHPVATGTTLGVTLEPYGLVFVVFDADARSVTLDSGTNVVARLALDTRPSDVRALGVGETLDFERTPRVLLLTSQGAATASLSVR